MLDKNIKAHQEINFVQSSSLLMFYNDMYAVCSYDTPQ